MLIRLHGCAGWSAPLLFAYGITHVFVWPCAFTCARFRENPKYLDIQKKWLSLTLKCDFTIKEMCWKDAGKMASILDIYQTAPSLLLSNSSEGAVWSGSMLFAQTCLQILSRLMTKPTKWHVRPAKTQISLGIHPVGSESSMSVWSNLGSSATHWTNREDWSDWADAQADLSLCWVHKSFCWCCHAAAQLSLRHWNYFFHFSYNSTNQHKKIRHQTRRDFPF